MKKLALIFLLIAGPALAQMEAAPGAGPAAPRPHTYGGDNTVINGRFSEKPCIVSGTSGTLTLDASTCDLFHIGPLTGSTTVVFSNPKPGQTLRLEISANTQTVVLPACVGPAPIAVTGNSFIIYDVFDTTPTYWCPAGVQSGLTSGMIVLSAVTSTLSGATGVTSQTVSINLTAGTVLIVGVGNDDGSTGAQVSSITGTGISGCASYTGVSSGVRYYLQMWHCVVGTSGTGVTVTVNLAASTGNVTVSALDVSGANATPDDGVGNYNDTGLTLPAGFSYSISGTGATHQANELIVVCAMVLSPTTVTVGSGYTVVGTPTTKFGCGYQTQSVIGVPSGTMNFAASSIGAVGIAATKGQ